MGLLKRLLENRQRAHRVEVARSHLTKAHQEGKIVPENNQERIAHAGRDEFKELLASVKCVNCDDNLFNVYTTLVR